MTNEYDNYIEALETQIQELKDIIEGLRNDVVLPLITAPTWNRHCQLVKWWRKNGLSVLDSDFMEKL